MDYNTLTEGLTKCKCGGIIMSNVVDDRVVYVCIDCGKPYEGNIALGYGSLHNKNTTGDYSGPFGKIKEEGK